MAPPFILQQLLGDGTAFPESANNNEKRVSNPTNATPCTFNLNWNYSENGPTQPVPQDDRITYMGPAITEHAGKGKRWNMAYAVKAALDIFRAQGLTCDVPPDDYEFRTEINKEEKEMEYLKEEYYDNFKLQRANETVVSMTTQSDWLYIDTTTEYADVVEKLNEQHFVLAPIEHKETTVLEEDHWEVIQRTGTKQGGELGDSIGTMFLLQKNNKTISKALCSYSNGEMNASGPTIEQMETAAEWQGHGHGSRLLQAMEEHFEAVFEPVMDETRVKFNVCYVTNSHASRWFQHQGFHDLDGMGEELGKELGDY